MKNIIVIDNFYNMPYKVRDLALNKTEYLDKNSLPFNFPGTESRQSFYSQSLIDRINVATGESMVVDPSKFSFGVFAKTFAHDERKKVVHVDSSDWTALVYLSLPEHCKGGTVFYEDRETGLSSIPKTQELERLGYSSSENFNEKFIKPRAQSLRYWKTTARIAMKFNRMVLFRAGSLFHASEDYFGETDNDCRLIQLFFFKSGGAI